jgi:hypothetical protein
MAGIVRRVPGRTRRRQGYDRTVPAPLVLIAVIGGFAIVAVLLAALNGGRPVDLAGLFPTSGRNDWPQGVQEDDLPRFRVDHAEALRRGAHGSDGAATPRIEELRRPSPPMPRIERVATRGPRFALRY